MKKEATVQTTNTLKFIGQGATLRDALARVTAVIPSKSSLPQLECVLVDLKGNTLTLTGTDLENTVTTSLEVSGVVDGTANIPAKLLHGIVSALPEGELTIPCDKAANRAELQTAHGNYHLPLEKAEELPNGLKDFKPDKSVEIHPVLLNHLISKTLFAVSTDDLRPSLMGVLFQFSPNGLRVISTDGHRLVRIITDVKTEFSLDAIVAPKALSIVQKTCEDNNRITLSFSRTHVQFHAGSTVILGKLIDERFPDYEVVIPKKNDKKLLVSRDALMDALKRVSMFAHPNTRQIRFQLSSNRLTIVAENPIDFTEAREEIACDYASDPLIIGFNSRLMMDALQHYDFAGIQMRFSELTRAAILETPGEDSQDESEIIMLVMPVRLNS
jgi:DNA polymerase-3 subunit beta